MATLSNLHPSDNTLPALVQPLGALAWWLTGAYEPTSDAAKVEFMQELVDVRELIVGPWMIASDFNLLVNLEDKNNDSIN